MQGLPAPAEEYGVGYERLRDRMILRLDGLASWGTEKHVRCLRIRAIDSKALPGSLPQRPGPFH
eukprot:195352-Rhodomonas_salina.2